MEDIILTITNEDVLGIKTNSMEYDTMRIAARGIIFKDDKIAILNKVNRHTFKLPGGGYEDGEQIEDTLRRELLEETGCEVDIVSKLGVIDEYRNDNRFRQLSHIFICNVTNDTNSLALTEHEIEDGARLVWLTIDEALNNMKESYNYLKDSNDDKKYNSLFVLTRDIKALEYYKETIK